MPGPRFLQCSAAEQDRLRLAILAAQAKLTPDLCGLTGLDELRRSMLAHLGGFRPLIIACSECEGLPADGFTFQRGKGIVAVCRTLLTGHQERVNAVLFHELVHACGGDEMDAEGLECHCFKDGEATPPSSSDYRRFRSLPEKNGYHLGHYLMWNPVTGQVYVRAPGDQPGAALNVRFQARRQ